MQSFYVSKSTQIIILKHENSANINEISENKQTNKFHKKANK